MSRLSRVSAWSSLASLLLAGSPVAAQTFPRDTAEWQGISLHYPKDDADLVDRLKPALSDYRQKRQAAAREEAEALAAEFDAPQVKEGLRQRLTAVLGRGKLSERFDEYYAAARARHVERVEAWRQWSGDVREVHFWNLRETAAFQVPRPPGETGGPPSFSFPDISYAEQGRNFEIKAPLSVLSGMRDGFWRGPPEKPAAMRLDLPLFYKPGEPEEQIVQYPRALLAELPAQQRNLAARLGGEGLQPRFIEELAAAEIRGIFFRDTPEEAALVEAAARYATFVIYLTLEGQEKAARRAGAFFHIANSTDAAPDGTPLAEEFLRRRPMENLSTPLSPPLLEGWRITLLAFSFLEASQKLGTPFFHRLSSQDRVLPEGGLDAAGLVAALDGIEGKEGLFSSLLAETQKASGEQFQKMIAAARIKAPPSDPPPSTAASQDRLSDTFDGLSITYPKELKEAVAVIGPEFGRLHAAAQPRLRALAGGPEDLVILEAKDEDLATLRKHGLEGSLKILRSFATNSAMFTNGRAISARILGGGRMQIWFKEDIRADLKAGRPVAEFELDADGEGVTYQYGAKFDLKDSLDTKESLWRKITAMESPNYPIVLIRAKVADRLGDADFLAGQIRENETSLTKSLRQLIDTPENELAPGKLPVRLMSPEMAWFLAMHETAEVAIIQTVIQSADRRWFCDGVANWLALRDVERRFGPGKGREAFLEAYDEAKMKARAAEVSLLEWPTVEDENSGAKPAVEDSTPHYYFATQVIEKAVEGQGDDFVKRWLEEIRRTPLQRTNASTVIAAYDKLTDRSLKEIISQTVR